MSLTTATKRFIIDKMGQKTLKYEINHFARQKYILCGYLFTGTKLFRLTEPHQLFVYVSECSVMEYI